MNDKIELVLKSVGASFLISLGNYALLKLGSPIGPVIFAFGLLGVCYLGQNLFTGKCGFFIEDKIPFLDLMIILIVNLVAGYLFGLMYSITDESLIVTAVDKVKTWDFSLAFLIKSFLCGTIMYIAEVTQHVRLCLAASRTVQGIAHHTSPFVVALRRIDRIKIQWGTSGRPTMIMIHAEQP